VPWGGAGGDCMSVAAASVTAESAAITGSRYAGGTEAGLRGPESTAGPACNAGPAGKVQRACGISRRSRGPKHRA
jgi:hypothetical protein